MTSSYTYRAQSDRKVSRPQPFMAQVKNTMTEVQGGGFDRPKPTQQISHGLFPLWSQ